MSGFEYNISWDRAGGTRQRHPRQTLPGAINLLNKRLGERAGGCLIPSHGSIGGADCWDRLSQADLGKAQDASEAGESLIGFELCVVCAERFAEDVAIQRRPVGAWVTLDPRRLELAPWAACEIEEASRPLSIDEAAMAATHSALEAEEEEAERSRVLEKIGRLHVSLSDYKVAMRGLTCEVHDPGSAEDGWHTTPPCYGTQLEPRKIDADSCKPCQLKHRLHVERGEVMKKLSVATSRFGDRSARVKAICSAVAGRAPALAPDSCQPGSVDFERSCP